MTPKDKPLKKLQTIKALYHQLDLEDWRSDDIGKAEEFLNLSREFYNNFLKDSTISENIKAYLQVDVVITRKQFGAYGAGRPPQVSNGRYFLMLKNSKKNWEAPLELCFKEILEAFEKKTST